MYKCVFGTAGRIKTFHV